MIGIDNYLAMGSVKSAWITIYILSIIYGVLYTIYPLFETTQDIGDVENKNTSVSSGGLLVS
jgi:hypothetical protein